MKAWKTTVTREHLFDENARVACAKQMDESITCDGLRTNFSGVFDRIHLRGADPFKNELSLVDIFKRGVCHYLFSVSRYVQSSFNVRLSARLTSVRVAHIIFAHKYPLTVSQVSSGRKNRLFYEINESRSSLGWDSEKPNELWIGHRTEANQSLMKDSSLLSAEARAVSSYPGGHNEGFPDTFKQLYNKVYNYILAGNFNIAPDFPTFADGH